ncbi:MULTISPECIES: HypC/HybG/HupF family hydrogenase formation chaperone [unclassified Campylobacter]|uniref:HypC/HybG/HupF family hydrogenase formation chaperone n=1 Tax=unclassified Campylobacter TaxID=2593542 RepID=UPI001BDB28AF|nr:MULTISPECIES: HypC/HybG/HupF family hydrogenase formation chaperone [unclassified Campylobacter]MBZ7976541.1 HypC/HybG/HupF family hydrogenase formation chaperone [Campylobacter sp. RM12637]MBZ7978662.1 HypC/HybG/HupF family hydrogenase formation chaperone [Campylobacter sp. RM12654]MBZ7980165.1 HypC/HybG/HupF family hydrogenase formation chaperone [Campylobacter sp. RM12642]MBZ7982862.1 HypC/HybG/HupF family hydrogenase formation chaperone [Campylobacter sp. RM12647]MBZ7991125.1 HypC/HybG/
MCLSIPSKVLSVDENNFAQVDTLGIKRGVSLDLIPEQVNVGDFVLIHVGFAMQKIDEAAAKESLELYKQIADEIGSEEIESRFL